MEIVAEPDDEMTVRLSSYDRALLAGILDQWLTWRETLNRSMPEMEALARALVAQL